MSVGAIISLKSKKILLVLIEFTRIQSLEFKYICHADNGGRSIHY